MSSDRSVPSPPAGWYPDPTAHGTLRYWDGAAWTDRRHSTSPPATTPGTRWSPPAEWQQPSGWQQPPGWAPAVGDSGPCGYGAAYPAPAAVAPPSLPLGVAKGLQALLAVQGVGFALLTIAGLDYYSAGVDFLDAPSVLNADALLDAEDTYNSGWVFQLLVGIATFVLLVIWSYRGTKWAQSQGAELRYGPGWAIGGWFLPIASLFVPFQVLNDLHRYTDPSLPRPIRTLHRGRPGSSHLWGWYLSSVAAVVLIQWSSTLFDLTDTESDIRLGLALRVIAPVAAGLSMGMLLVYVRSTVRRFERAQHNNTSGVAAPYAVSRHR